MARRGVKSKSKAQQIRAKTNKKKERGEAEQRKVKRGKAKAERSRKRDRKGDGQTDDERGRSASSLSFRGQQRDPLRRPRLQTAARGAIKHVRSRSTKRGRAMLPISSLHSARSLACNQPAAWDASSRSNSPVPSTSASPTSELTVRVTRAAGFSRRTTLSRVIMSDSVARSALLRRMTFAISTCGESWREREAESWREGGGEGRGGRGGADNHSNERRRGDVGKAHASGTTINEGGKTIACQRRRRAQR